MSIGTRYHNCLFFFFFFLDALFRNENRLGISCKFKTLYTCENWCFFTLVKIDVSTFRFLIHLFFSFYVSFFDSFSFHAFGKAENAFLLTTTMWCESVHKTSHLNSKIDPKWGTTTIASIHSCFPSSQNFNNKGFLKKPTKQIKMSNLEP